MLEPLEGKVIALFSPYGNEMSPVYRLRFKEDVDIKAGDEIVFSPDGYSLSIYISRKDEDGEVRDIHR